MSTPNQSENSRLVSGPRKDGSRSPPRGRARRIAWTVLVTAGAVGAVIVPLVVWGGPVEWFADFSVSPEVAYTGDINVTLSATVVGLSGPVSNLRVMFVTYPVLGAAPLVLQSALSGPNGVATAHVGSPTHPFAASTLRIFAQFEIPGTAESVTSAPAVLQVFSPPIA